MVGMVADPVIRLPFTYAFLPLVIVPAAAASVEMVVSTTMLEPA